MFDNWAQPVTSKPWALVCVVLDRIKRASGFRLAVHSSHRAWERACGLSAKQPWWGRCEICGHYIDNPAHVLGCERRQGQDNPMTDKREGAAE